MKVSKDRIGNRTRQLPSCGIVPRKICGEQNGTGTDFSVSPCQYHPTHLYLHAALTRMTNGGSLKTFQEATLFFGNQGALDGTVLSVTL